MAETRRKFDQDFKAGAVRLVRETGKPIAQIARDLGVNEGTLGNWVNADKRRPDGNGALSEDERAELARLRRVSNNTGAGLMGEFGLAARQKRRRRCTTRPGKGRWRAPDLIKRDFAAGQLNQKWFGDGTEIDTNEGKLHLDSALDMGSRRVLGF